MPASAMEYPKETRNTVNRKGKMRGKYQLETVHTIIQQARVVHVSFTPFPDDPFPVILPMIAVMGERFLKRIAVIDGLTVFQAHTQGRAQAWTNPRIAISMAMSRPVS
jgi:hypothetical protein